MLDYNRRGGGQKSGKEWLRNMWMLPKRTSQLRGIAIDNKNKIQYNSAYLPYLNNLEIMLSSKITHI